MNETQRYQRILRDDDRTTEDPEDRMEVMSQGSNRRLKRRGSHGSLGSFLSIHDDDEQINMTDNDNDDRHNHPLDGDERLPLSKSFDQDEEHAHEPPSHVDTSAAAAASPIMYSSSFNLDDDEDDDDADLKRYNLDFSSSMNSPNTPHTTTNSNTNMLGSTSLHDGSSPAFQLSSSNNSFPKYVWFSFQSLRQKARQRRAQRLLQQSERNCRQTLYLCIMTYCDATDRGIGLVASVIILWSLLIWNLPKSHQTVFAMTGIALFLVRVGARPCWEWYTMRRREQRRQRAHTMSDDAGTGIHTHAATPTDNMRLNYSDHQPELLFANEPASSLSSSSSSSNNNTQLELQSMRRANGKANNNTTLMETTTMVPNEADPVIHTV
jgi:hypothetical protein